MQKVGSTAHPVYVDGNGDAHECAAPLHTLSVESVGTGDVIAKIHYGDQEFPIKSFNVVGSAYLVSFIDHDSSLLKEEPVLLNEDATPPDNPSWTGHVFTGWLGNYKNVQRDENVYAQYIGIIEASINYTAGSNSASVTVTNPASGAKVYYRTSADGAWVEGSTVTATDTTTFYFKVEASTYQTKGADNSFGITITRTASGYAPDYIRDPTEVGGKTQFSYDKAKSAIAGSGYKYWPDYTNKIAWRSPGPWAYINPGASSCTIATGTSHSTYSWSGETFG